MPKVSKGEMEFEQMEMDEDQLVNFVYDAYEDEVFDFQYEFDAPRFFDFTCPETKGESSEADRWFETFRGYPPPPFLMKWKWTNDMPVEKLESFGNSKGMERTWNGNMCCMESEFSTFDDIKTGEGKLCTIWDDNGVRCCTEGMRKPDGKSRGNSSSTLMNPTASHLAKQRKPCEAHNIRSLHRTTERQATKRQKLEASYICKGAYLKLENSFPHKLRKVKPSDVDVPTRTRVTIPKEPHLETANRAQRHRLKVDPKTAEQATSNGYIFKAQPLNRKILEASSLPLHKKSAPQLPDFHEFRFKTSERALHHTYNNMSSPKLNTNNTSDFSLHLRSEAKVTRRPNSSESWNQERRSTSNKVRGGPLSKIINERKLVRDLPTELFSKLSLASEVHEMVKPQPNDHVMKENNPASIHGKNKIVELVQEGM